MTDFVKSIEIIHLAKSKGINLFVDKGRLAIKKEESSALPPDLMELIQAHKTELIDFLEQELQSPQQAGYQEIPNVAVSESYPISNAQYRIWLVSQTEEGSVAYHVPNTIVVNNALNEAAFRSAVDAVIERHEILRTVFKIGDAGEVRQYVLSSSELGFSIYFNDFRAEKEAHATCKEYIASDVNKPFDLSRGPLLRAALLRIADEQYVFYYNMHHIISDAWSREVLSRDVMNYYKAYMMGVRPELAPLRIQYKDYAAWQVEQLSGPAFQDHKDYWLSRFREEVPLIDLPTSKRRPKRKTYRGQEIGLQLGPDTVAPLRNLAVERGGSLLMGLMAIWKILLHRYTGETDITIGNPVSGRNHPDLEDQIGFYINILPLRTRIDPDQPFTALFDQIKEETLAAYKHQAYPFGKLLEDLNLSRDVSRSPLFDLDMDYRTVAGGSEQASEAQGVQDRGMSLAKYDIEFDPIESANGVYLLMRFNLDVYEYPMMERLIGHYQNVLREVALHPEKRIRDVNYLSVFEQQQLLYQFNAAAVSYPPDQTVVDLFLTQVQKTPDAKAVVFSGKSLTYAELNGRSNRLAHYLISANGLVAGDFVGIHLDIGVDYMVAILGILKAGGAYVPIDTEYPSDRKKFLAENAAVKAIVTDTNYMFGIDFYEGNVLAIDVELDAVGEEAPINLARPEALAYVLHTSGSTGVPKGVMVEHRNLMDYSAGLVNTLGLNQAYSYGLMSTPSADLGNTVILGSLVTGGVLHLFSRAMVMDVFALNAYFQANPIDIIKIVPSHWLSLSSGDIGLLPRKTIVFGGEKLGAEVINKVSKQDAAVTIVNHYGPTETTIGKLMHQVDPEKPYTSIPLGKPFSNTSVYILDKNLHLVSVGVVGELYIAGAGLARGYLNSPEMTATKFIDHPFAVGQKVYKTGDLARWTPDGEVEFIGRADDQVKIRGHRVEVKEIECALNTVAGITQSVVVAKADSYGTAQLVAYLQSGKEVLDKVAIQEVLREKLPEYMMPRVYVQVAEIPLTSNGKIDYKALAARADAESSEDAYVAPGTPEEEALAAAWQSVLKRDQIGILDNFYHLGGDSLKAIQLFILLKKKGYDLPITFVIENPTLKDMAAGMQRIPDDPSLALEPEPAQPTQHAGTEASENQKYFIKRPWAMVPSRTITLSNFSETTFREKLVAFLSGYPSLLTEFERDEKDGTIRQRLVPYSDVKLAIELIREYNTNDYTQAQLEEMAGAFLAAPFAYFTHAPLIRFFLVVDPDDASRAFLRFSVAHALIDIDTSRHITENLERHWEAPEVEENAGSNYSFAQWQKHFLGSAEGALQRKWWLAYLKPLQPENHPEPYNGQSVEYVTQRLEITGEPFKSIQETVKTLNVPIAALFLAAHQCLLSELGEDQYLQKIAVNGREQNYEEGEVRRVLGLTTNFLPVRILPARSLSFRAYVREVYGNYMQVRLRQNIPYEVIRKDLLGETGSDIDQAIKGYFNFRVKEKMRLQGNASPDATISVTAHQQNNVYGVGLICDLFENGLAIRLKCPKDVFTQYADQIRLSSFIHGKLLDPIASGSYF